MYAVESDQRGRNLAILVTLFQVKPVDKVEQA